MINQEQSSKRQNTLLLTKKIGSRLIIPELETKSRSILVISQGQEHRIGECELKVGDDVYLASRKLNYIAFAHYKITSLEAENHCRIIYTRRISNRQKNQRLPERYKTFIREFRRKHDLYFSY